MEVTQRFVMIVLVIGLLIASSNAQIIVQPGYSPQGHQGNSRSPMHQNSIPHKEPLQSLLDEFQRNQVLQRMVENQILQMVHERQAQRMPLGMVGRPLPLHPHIGGGRLFPLAPSGMRGLHMGGYGLARPPLLLREASPLGHTNYADRTLWPRSVLGGSGGDSDDDSKVHDVASESPVEEESVTGVDDLPIAQALAADDTADKLVEPRHTGPSDDAIVGSPLDRIHYDQPYNYDQHHPMNPPGTPSQFMKAAHGIGQVMDTVASGLMDSRSDYENRDTISSMTRHQDPAGNYQQLSQYLQEEQSPSPSNWNAPTASSNKQSMTEQSNNGQQPENLDQSSQNPTARAIGDNRYFQQEPAYQAGKNLVNDWIATARTLINRPKGYNQYHHQPGYNLHKGGLNNKQPGYPKRPQAGGLGPNTKGHMPFHYAPPAYRPDGTATGALASHYNSYHPYHRSSYEGYTPYSFSGAFDQFGRAIYSKLPTAINSIISNPRNMDYLSNIGGQISQAFTPYRYY